MNSTHFALITGASSGIGEEYAKQLAQQGCNLLLIARRGERLTKLKHDLEAKHPSIEIDFLVQDLTEKDAAQKIYSWVTTNNRWVTILINNAGSGSFGPFIENNLIEYRKMIALNVQSIVDIATFFVPHMLEHKQSSYLCHVASMAGYIPVPQFAVYSGTKAFVQSFSECLASEVKNTNIKVSTLSPGGVFTEFSQNAGQKVKSAKGIMYPKEVVQYALQQMYKGKRRFIPGLLNRILVFTTRFLPKTLMVELSGKVMRQSVTKI